MPQPRPPQHLQAETKRWFSAVLREFELESHHVRLLTLACEAWDRGQAARATIEAEGTYYKDRFGQPRAHPAVAIERDSHIAFARLLRELGLDVDTPNDSIGRPPQITPGSGRRVG